MTAKTFWGNVKPLIKSKKITQQGLAEIIEVPFFTLQSWISRDRLPDVVSAYKIARALGVSVEYLVTGEEIDEKSKILKEMQSVIDRFS